MNKCAVTVLKTHSSGVAGTKFAPVMLNGLWRLQNANGDVLVGYRGKIYEFENQQNASNWLCTNLSRYKNKTGKTDINYLYGLGKIYIDTGLEAIREDLRNIYDFEAGLWQVIECAGATEYITVEASIDYDGGNANGLII
jgi:hypothetical protein